MTNATPLSILQNPAAVSDTATGSSDAGYGGDDSRRRISADGRYVVFTSSAPNLVPGQSGTTGVDNVYLYDSQTLTVRLISHAAGAPGVGGNDYSASPVISADGTRIAYYSFATTLVAGYSGDAVFNVYTYDVGTGMTTLVSHADGAPTTAGNGFSLNPAISADGGRIVYTSTATNLIGGYSGSTAINVYAYDVGTGTTILVSHADGAPTSGGNNGAEYDIDSGAPVISADGSRIAYYSLATNLIGNYSGSATHNVYVYDVGTATTTLVSHANGAPTTGANGASGSPVISADGSRIAYGSTATDLIAGYSGSMDANIYVYDVDTGTTTLVSHADGAASTGANSASLAPVISADGSRIAYASFATDLIGGFSGSEVYNIYVYDAGTGATTLVSHADGAANVGGNGYSSSPAISADGSRIAYGSSATNLVGGFSSGGTFSGGELANVYTYDVGTGTTTLVSHVAGTASAGGNGASGSPTISADGNRIAYGSAAAMLEAGVNDANGSSDVLLYTVASAVNRYVSRIDPNSPAVSAAGSSSVASIGRSRGDGSRRRISADGRYVVFTSIATLVPGQSGRRNYNVYLYDSRTATVRLISHVDGAATTGGNGVSYNAVISADGSRVAYESNATDLIAGFSGGGFYNIYAYDVGTGTTRLVSHADGAATTGGSNRSTNPVISADGSRIAYDSVATNLIAGYSAGEGIVNVYAYTVAMGTTTLVSHAAGAPTTGGNGTSYFPVISADGSRIAYESGASNLIAGYSGEGIANVYAYDLGTGATTLVSQASGAPTAAGDGSSFDAVISADGSRIAYTSYAENLVGGYSGDGSANIYAYDVATRTTLLVSHVDGAPTTGSDGRSFGAVISADGSRIAYYSDATDLIGGFSGGGFDNVYAYDVAARATTLVSHADGAPTAGGNGASDAPVISADGSRIAYTSTATNLIGGYAAGQPDDDYATNVYAYDAGTGVTLLVSHAYGTATTSGKGDSDSVVISADGSALAFNSHAGDLSMPGGSGQTQAYYYALTPVVTLSPTRLDLGTIAVGDSSDAQTVTLTNSGAVTLNLDSVSITGPNAADFVVEGNTCGGSVAPGASCVITVSFTPSTTNRRVADLSIASDADSSPDLVALVGNGSGPSSGGGSFDLFGALAGLLVLLLQRRPMSHDRRRHYR